MTLYVPPVTDLELLSRYNQLSTSPAGAVISESQGKFTSNVEREKKKEDPTNPNTTTKRVIEWGLYNIKGQHVQTPHIGVNIDKTA